MQVRSYIPEEKRRRRKRRIYYFAVVALLAIYFVSFGVIWFIFRSPIFRVNHIVVQGNVSVPSDAIVSLVEAAVMPPQSRTLLIKPLIGYGNMFVWPSSIPSSTLKWIPELASLKVNKDYFSHTITITVTERTPLAIWCYMPKGDGDEQCFWFDETGDMFQRTYDTEGNVITVVHDFSQKPTGVNQQILPEEFVSNLVSIINLIKGDHVNISDVVLSDLSLEEIDVTTLNGPALYFSLRFPADNYDQVIQELMAQPLWNKISYIDCRTENRVYYK